MATVASSPSRPRVIRRRVKLCAFGLVIYAIAMIYFGMLRSLPEGLNFAGEAHAYAPGQVQFLRDLTYRTDEEPRHDQQIFDEVLRLIDGAQDFVLIDMFLFNNYLGQSERAFRPISRELMDALLAARKRNPEIRIVVVSDPINEVYGGAPLLYLENLRLVGITVVTTDLDALRDSNLLYSPIWRGLFQWFGTGRGGIMPHPFDPAAPRVGLRNWLKLVNFKANHRKIMVADARAPDFSRQMVAIVSSANPHDGSSAHSNVALRVQGGDLWRDLLASEQAVLDFSAPSLPKLAAFLPDYAQLPNPSPKATDEPALTVQLLTEEAIADTLSTQLAETGPGDQIDVDMFYFSDGRLVDAVTAAAQRGAQVRVVLDQNRDAFGYAKDGVPNVVTAAKLVAEGGENLSVRWYQTHGEQFHAKLVLIRDARGSATAMMGSANLTRRNVRNLNLETDVCLRGPTDAPPLREVVTWCERIWGNEDGEFTEPYEALPLPSTWLRVRSAIQEATGAGTF